MSTSDIFDIGEVAKGWFFVNLFYDIKKQVFYCRIQQYGTDKIEVFYTASGATAAIALSNANDMTKGS